MMMEIIKDVLVDLRRYADNVQFPQFRFADYDEKTELDAIKATLEQLRSCAEHEKIDIGKLKDDSNVPDRKSIAKLVSLVDLDSEFIEYSISRIKVKGHDAYALYTRHAGTIFPRGQRCSVCHENTATPENPIVDLNCHGRLKNIDDPEYIGHWFHEECANGWLAQRRNCPLCRKPVVDRAVNDVVGNPLPDGDGMVVDHVVHNPLHGVVDATVPDGIGSDLRTIHRSVSTLRGWLTFIGGIILTLLLDLPSSPHIGSIYMFLIVTLIIAYIIIYSLVKRAHLYVARLAAREGLGLGFQ